MEHYRRGAGAWMRSGCRGLLPLLSLFLSALFLPACLPGSADEAQRLLVTVSTQVGFPVRDLKAQDFKVKLENAERPVQAARYETHPLADVVLLLETSEVGAQLQGEIQRVAQLFIDGLSEKDQMAIIGYATSADLVQDFTASKALLRRAVAGLQYGNPPVLLDAIYAALDGAFEHAAGRRVLVVVGSGLTARGKVRRNEVAELARRHAVSIFAISFGYGGGDLERLTEQTAGDFYSGKELRQIQQVAQNILEAFRGNYELVLPGPPLDAGKLKVEVPRGEKLRISYRLAR